MTRRSVDNPIDWQAIERQYRLGKKSNTQLAIEFGASLSAIGRRATKHDWIADKAEEVDAATTSLLIQHASGRASHHATPTALEIKVAAQVAADIVISHRSDARRSRTLMQKLLTELEFTTDNQELFEKLGEMLDESGPDSNGTWRKDTMNELYKKVISMGGRVDNAKKLVEILEKLVKLERQAFSIQETSEKSAGYEDLLERISSIRS